jgi:threonine/homoserine/homoserine lactone efflux protein
MAMVLIVGLGLGVVFDLMPALYVLLKYVSIAYLLYLAWMIANAGPLKETERGGRPMTFLQAAAFQWVNPKAWVMAVTAMATYTSEQRYLASVLVVGLIFAIVNVPSVSTWAGFGSVLRAWLSDPVRLKWFNITMAALLVLSLWPMLK